MKITLANIQKIYCFYDALWHAVAFLHFRAKIKFGSKNSLLSCGLEVLLKCGKHAAPEPQLLYFS